MVRLLRLQTYDDNCVFDCNFDSDILIGENASIGLKNLIFTPNETMLDINSSDGKITFVPEFEGEGQGEIGNIFKEQTMETSSFNANEIEKFTQELERTLNRTLSFLDGKDNNRFTLAAGSCFSVDLNTGGENGKQFSINFYLCPVVGFVKSIYLSPDGTSLDKFPENSPTNLYFKYSDKCSDIYKKITHEAVAGQSNNFYFSVNDSETPVRDFRFRHIARYGISKGSGCYYCRIVSSSADGDPTVPNGFRFGLTFNTEIFEDDALITIPEKDRNFEIVFTDPNTAYSHRSSNVGESGTEIFIDANGQPILPELVNGGVENRHDILLFKYDTNEQGQKCISSFIIQETAGATLLSEFQLGTDSQNATCTPYIIFHANKNKIKVDLLRFSPDVSTLDENRELIRDFPLQDDSPLSTGGGGVGVANAGTNQTVVSALNLNQVRFGIPGRPEATRKSSKINFSDDLLDVMGLKTPTGLYNSIALIEEIFENDGRPNFVGFVISSKSVFALKNRDFFIVEFLNLQLDSYDSSIAGDSRERKQGIHSASTNGRRRNILATVPYEEGTKGFVDFQANEVDYIDINNGIPVSIRNLKVRVLDENFKKIFIDSIQSANMTLLLKDDSIGRRFV